MILFLLGLVLGAAIATALTHVYAQNEVKSFSHDLALLQARLRTLVRLTEAGLIKPDSVEAASVLNEVHEMVSVDRSPHLVVRPQDAGTTDAPEEDESVSSVYR